MVTGNRLSIEVGSLPGYAFAQPLREIISFTPNNALVASHWAGRSKTDPTKFILGRNDLLEKIWNDAIQDCQMNRKGVLIPA